MPLKTQYYSMPAFQRGPAHFYGFSTYVRSQSIFCEISQKLSAHNKAIGKKLDSKAPMAPQAQGGQDSL